MKDIPILFKGEMIRRILPDMKTQTRRVMKTQPGSNCFDKEPFDTEFRVYMDNLEDGPGAYVWDAEYPEDGYVEFHKPRYQPGDHIWVKETFDVGFVEGNNATLLYRADGKLATVHLPDEKSNLQAQRAEWKENSPSIHMPRWASRIDLEVLTVGAERIQDISHEDIFKEGIDPGEVRTIQRRETLSLGGATRYVFRELWDSINASPKKAKKNPYTGEKEECYVSYPWEEIRRTEEHKGLTHYIVGNPWVWAYGFKRVGAIQ